MLFQTLVLSLAAAVIASPAAAAAEADLVERGSNPPPPPPSAQVTLKVWEYEDFQGPSQTFVTKRGAGICHVPRPELQYNMRSAVQWSTVPGSGCGAYYKCIDGHYNSSDWVPLNRLGPEFGGARLHAGSFSDFGQYNGEFSCWCCWCMA